MERVVEVSIIIPVYNTEKYLNKCLDSLINQTLENIEIICVDDGSSDNSLEILNKYAFGDSRIKVISQANKKQGSARNAGIKIAKGNYIGFVDSDDYVASDYFEKLYKIALNNNSDIACGSIVRVREHKQKYRLLYEDKKCVTKLEEKLKTCTSIGQDYSWNVWNKIYKKSFLLEKNIWFDESVYFEDVNFTIKALYHAKSVVSVPNTNYYYYARPDSIVKGVQDSKKRNDLLNAYLQLWAYCIKHNIEISPKNRYCTQIYFRVFNIILFAKKTKCVENEIITSFKLFNTFKIFQKKTLNPYIAYDYPIDLIYTWCDGVESKFKQEREFWRNKLGVKDSGNNFNCQWMNNDELKYSLRSADMYAPWIRNIYIITNSQRPDWLKETDRVKVVDVKDIMPACSLPTFNSQAIETCLPFINGLAEHFLYANDDMFFNNKVDKSFFFDEKGRPVVRLQGKISKKTLLKSQYARTIISAQNKVKDLTGKRIEYSPHHSIDSYTKTIFLDCMKDFKPDFERTVNQKFRCEDSLQRAIILYRAIAKKEAVLRLIKPFNLFSRDSKCIAMNCPKKLKYLSYKPIKLFCINDDSRATDNDRKQIKEFLEHKFSEKSSCEI